MSVKLIPCFCSSDLPGNVREELEDYENEKCSNFCFHGDDGCVFTIWDTDDENKLPLFLNWLAGLGMITLPLDFYSMKEYESVTDSPFPTFVQKPAHDQWRAEYQAWCKIQESRGRREYFQFAMTGT